MSEERVNTVHWSYWAISGLALIWYVMGVINFIRQMNADALTAFPESHRAVIEGRPAWATGAFAIAMFGGVIGSLLLLLKKTAAYGLFVVSLLGVVVTMAHTLGMAKAAVSFTPFEIAIAIVAPLVVAVFLVWYAKRVKDQGWLSRSI